MLLYEKTGITNNGAYVPIRLTESLPYWFSQGFFEDKTLFFSSILIIPTIGWSIFTVIDMIYLIIRGKTRAELFYRKEKIE